MAKIIDKYNCGNCDFWASIPSPENLSFGRCRKDPPINVLRLFREPKRMYPLTLAGEICSHHPVLRADVLRGMVAGCVRAYLDMLDYKPGKYPDETAAGFSRPPTLAEAKGLAAGATEKPTAPVDKVAT